MSVSGQLGNALFLYLTAAFFEITGSFALWAVFRLHRNIGWLLPGTLSLLLFAFLLTRIDVALAGRAYAAYGGIYIVASLAWLWLAEGRIPDRWDLLGAGFALIGTLIILLGSLLSS